ncbi:hypothetical protein J3F83DRAFT_757372 [Trichoderma novae-zelandiae]
MAAGNWFFCSPIFLAFSDCMTVVGWYFLEKNVGGLFSTITCVFMIYPIKIDKRYGPEAKMQTTLRNKARVSVISIPAIKYLDQTMDHELF